VFLILLSLKLITLKSSGSKKKQIETKKYKNAQKDTKKYEGGRKTKRQKDKNAEHFG
jgi:hypothetical protein